MLITEIFHSLQGEGPWSGCPAVFVRTGGCIKPYCPWCDTAYALDEYQTMSVPDVVREVDRYHCRRVVITGGEPFIQWENGLSELHRLLLENGHSLQYETSGKVFVPRLDDALVVMSPKFIGKKWTVDEASLEAADFFKFVATGEDSFPVIKDFISTRGIVADTVYIMPEGATRSSQLEHMEKVFLFCIENNFRMSARLHTLTFDNKRRI